MFITYQNIVHTRATDIYNDIINIKHLFVTHYYKVLSA